MPPLYLLTVNYYAADLIAELLASIDAGDRVAALIVVNNSPADAAIGRLAHPSVQMLPSKTNLGFGAACNLGLGWVYAQAPHAIVWLINPDARLQAGAVRQAVALFAAHPERSIVGTRVMEPDGQLWFGGGRFNARTGAITMIDAFASPAAPGTSDPNWRECDWVTGCSLLLNLGRFAACPTFDPAYFLYYEDFDFCQRYRQQGHVIGITNAICVIHQPSSITDRAPQLKLRSSTESYLLALERYTSKLTWLWRLGRLATYALLLLPLRPAVALGKLQGIYRYLRQQRGRNPTH